MREALLLAAIDAFGSRGFEGVSLRQIADVVGADTGLTRYYFGSKSALWCAAIDHLAVSLGDELEDVIQLSNDSSTEQLKSAIRWFVDASARWPQLSRIIVFEGISEGERGRYVTDQLVRPFYNLLSKLIKGAISEGSVPIVAPRTLFFLITHGGSFPTALPDLTNAFPGGNINDPRNLEAHSDSIIDLIFRNARVSQ